MESLNVHQVVGEVATSLEREFHRYGSQALHLPIVGSITGSCEQVNRNVRVGRSESVGEHTAVAGYLLQTGQIALEAALLHAESVSTVITSVRAEAEDKRHLQQFLLAEEEISWARLDMTGHLAPRALLELLCDRIEHVVRVALADLLETELLHPTRQQAIAVVLDHEWPRVDYGETFSLIDANDLKPEPDLSPQDEQLVVEHFGMLPVFVQRYPASIKFFNMRGDDDDTSLVLSADFLLPRAGETVGAAVREERPDRLRDKLNTSIMMRDHLQAGGSAADFDRYLELMRSGVPPHAGYGIGVERLVQFAMGINDIRRASSIRDLRSMLDW